MRTPEGVTAAMTLIRSDLRLAIAMSAALRRDSCASTAAAPYQVLSHLHYLHLVDYESRKFLGAIGERLPVRVHDDVAAASRNSFKLLNQRGGNGVVDTLREFTREADLQRSWFLENNRAPSLIRRLPMLSRLVQDSFIVLYDGNLLCTSQSATFHARLRPGSPRQALLDRSRELGENLRALADICDVRMGDDYWAGWRPSSVEVKDASWSVLYRQMFPGIDPALAMALGILEVGLVSLRLMGELAPSNSPLGPSAFKLRFVGVWQILQTLEEISVGGWAYLSSAKRGRLDELLEGDEACLLRTSGARRLRNTLMHYGIHHDDVENLTSGDELLGLTELHLGGLGWVTVDRLVGGCIDAIIPLLEEWQGDYRDALVEPH